MTRLLSLLAVFALLAAACTATPKTTIERVQADDLTTEPDPATPTVPTEPTTEPASRPTEPPVEVVPAPTTLVDDSEIVVQGDGWTTTQNEFDAMAALVEEAHGVAFTDPVGVQVSNDIGREFAGQYEPFRFDEWMIFRGLGLAMTEQERLESNQFRLDRIRGLCCRVDERGAVVVVELQGSKFATDLIIVHELTHALHNQHRDLRPQPAPPAESPYPAVAAFEGVPQFVAFNFMRTGSDEDQAAVEPDLPIVPDAMSDLVLPSTARHLNFAYATGPEFVAAIVEQQGADGLAQVLKSPPTTTEQVMFPEKYLAGEQAQVVETPEVPALARRVGGGRIGAAMFWFLLAEQHGDQAALAMVEPWAGDSSVIYELDDQLCLTAVIAMDSDDAAVTFGELLGAALLNADPNASVELGDRSGGLIDVTVCHAT